MATTHKQLMKKTRDRFQAPCLSMFTCATETEDYPDNNESKSRDARHVEFIGLGIPCCGRPQAVSGHQCRLDCRHLFMSNPRGVLHFGIPTGACIKDAGASSRPKNAGSAVNPSQLSRSACFISKLTRVTYTGDAIPADRFSK